MEFESQNVSQIQSKFIKHRFWNGLGHVLEPRRCQKCSQDISRGSQGLPSTLPWLERDPEIQIVTGGVDLVNDPRAI